MGEDPERRRIPRLSRHEKLFIRIASSQEHPELVGNTLRSSIDDLSPEGLRVRLQHPLEQGCTLELWVKLSDHPGSYLLTGEIMWQAGAPDDQGSYVTGLRLLDGFGEDHGLWQEQTGALEDPG